MSVQQAGEAAHTSMPHASQPARARQAAPGTKRDDIQGLRATCALMIAIFHIWLGGVSGGVDVFFVVGGYLLTQSALRTIDRKGALDIPAIWMRFATRILPGLIFSLIGVLVLMIFFVKRDLWKDALHHTAASAFYVHNWYMIWIDASQHVNKNVQHMTQHYWAIAMIGQSYFLLPLMLTGALIFARRRNLAARPVIAWMFVIFIAALYPYALRETWRDADFAYFNLFCRIWELGVGGLIATLFAPASSHEPPALDKHVPAWASAVLSWIGLFMLVSLAAIFGRWVDLPGFAALWPIGATVLLLLFGRPGNPLNAGALLAFKPLVAMGSISYGFYLWHWPVLVAFLNYVDWRTVAVHEGLAIIAVSIFLSWGSDKLGARILAMPGLKDSQPRSALLVLASLIAIGFLCIIWAAML